MYFVYVSLCCHWETQKQFVDWLSTQKKYGFRFMYFASRFLENSPYKNCCMHAIKKH